MTHTPIGHNITTTCLVLCWSFSCHQKSSDQSKVWTKSIWAHAGMSTTDYFGPVGCRMVFLWIRLASQFCYQTAICGIWRPGEHLRLFLMFSEPLQSTFCRRHSCYSHYPSVVLMLWLIGLRLLLKLTESGPLRELPVSFGEWLVYIEDCVCYRHQT